METPRAADKPWAPATLIIAVRVLFFCVSVTLKQNGVVCFAGTALVGNAKVLVLPVCIHVGAGVAAGNKVASSIGSSLQLSPDEALRTCVSPVGLYASVMLPEFCIETLSPGEIVSFLVSSLSSGFLKSYDQFFPSTRHAEHADKTTTKQSTTLGKKALFSMAANPRKR